MKFPRRVLPGRTGTWVWAALILLTILPIGPAAADTIFLATNESVDGSPCPGPLPLREGLSAALFEEGHIVFDDVEVLSTPPAEGLAALALSGGAAWVLEAMVGFDEERINTGLVRVAAETRWRLTRAADGSAAADGTLASSNQGREKQVDRAGLGLEIGATIARAISAALAPGR